MQRGWRLVFGLTPGRKFFIKSGDDMLLQTTAAAVGMDALAAGWQRRSTAMHGREGDGISLVLDVAQAPPDSTSGAYGAVESNEQLQRLSTFMTQP